MGTLAGRLHAIKVKTGGSREKSGWEMGTNVPPEVNHHITGLNSTNRRILAELAFAITLDNAEKNKYSPVISAALEILEKNLESSGALTFDACKAAEEALLPLQKPAKEYSVILAAHAHIDMNWMWGWQETVQSTLATFRTMLAMMDEYPEFQFSQSQAACYQIVEEHDPALMEAVKKRVAEGRWEVTASAWVETDKNIPNTESLLRHISCSKKYLETVWGVNPSSLNIDFSPDTFGHSANIPEIDFYGGVKYMYHCRALKDRHVLYRWRSPSGAEILSYCEPRWYNYGIQDDIALGAAEMASLCGGLKTSLIVYGVGDHGGGPTRRDIERILEMREWPVYPALNFGTFARYFKEAESVRDKVPVVDREINHIFCGCYSSQSRIKMGNRKTETALLDAELINSLSAALTGNEYPAVKLEQAWRKTLFTHFHDIITGTCIRDSRESAMAAYAEAQATAGTAHETACTAIAACIDTSAIAGGYAADLSDDRGNRSEGAGVGYGLDNFRAVPHPERGSGSVRIYHVFNPCPYKRREAVEFTLWDWDYDSSRMELCGHDGGVIPLQILDKEPVAYWEHRYIRFIASVEIPAGGYATVILREKDYGSAYPLHLLSFPRTEKENFDPIILENDYLRAEFNSGTGALYSLKDKKTNKEQIASGGNAGLVINWAEKATNNAWMNGRYLAQEAVKGVVRFFEHTGNPIRNWIEIEQEIYGSRIKTKVALDAGAQALSYQFTIDWNEAAKDHKNIPILCFTLPLEMKPDHYLTDIPAGIRKRDGVSNDVPALQFISAINGGQSVTISTDCTHSFKGCENILCATLISSTSGPDPYPERGEHIIRLAVALEDSEPKNIYDAAFAFCHPLSIISGTKHGGKLPPVKELLSINSASTVLSSSGLCPDGGILLRFYEMKGLKDKVTVNLPAELKNAVFVDLDGKNLKGWNEPVSVKGNSITFEMFPCRICGIKVSYLIEGRLL